MRGRFQAALAVLAIGGVATAALLGLGSGRAAAPPASELPPRTTEVTRQTLNDTKTVDGELGYGSSTTATCRVPGTLTYLPESGSVVTRGQALYKVNNKPVTLMYGVIPAYRTLTVDTDGPDVLQLEQNLSALGYKGFTVDEDYSSATATAVRRWQEDQALEETGTVELGRVVFAPGEVRVDSLQAGISEPVTSNQKVLTYTGIAKAITVELAVADQRLAKKGASVGVRLPDDRTVAGRINEVATVIEPARNPGDDPVTKVDVVVGIEDQKAVEAYALASVDVTFIAEERKDVLTLPVAALVALGEGGFGVEVVDGSATRYVPVRTGLFAGGRVEVSGDGIAEGLAVGMPK